MSKAIHTTAGNHAGPKSARGLEQYETPPCATTALLNVEPLPRGIWEPCAGAGNIVAVLRAHGHRVVVNDLADDGTDFLDCPKAPPGIGAIVTNPPFSLAAAFVRHGLTLVRKVVILERIQFLESEERSDIIEGGKLARVLVFANRVPRMHRLDWSGNRAAPAMCLAWFLFNRDHCGLPVIDRIRCDKNGSGT